MKTISRYIMTLVALLALTTQAWATDVYVVGNGTGNWLNDAIWDPGVAGNKMTEQNGVYSITFKDVDANSELLFKFALNGTWDVNYGCTSWDANELNKTLSNIEEFGNNIMFGLTEKADVTISFNLSELTYMISTKGMKVGDDTPVEWDAATKTGTFAMPGSDVVLTPIYAAATVYGADGQTEKMAYETLKEAIQNVQNGDVIKLDWDVTFTAQDDPIETSNGGEGVTFTLDLNGYTIDGTALEKPCIVLYNANDQMTITDSKLTGGIKGTPATGAGAIIFDGGRYFLGTEVNAEYLKTNWANYASMGWQLAEGKEFVDIENAPVDGFMFRVDYAAIELTIGAGRFATFYADQNTTLDEGQNIGFYTISNISDDRTEANVTPINSTIIPANTPTLVYNSGNDQQTVKMKVTTDAVNLTVDHVEQFKGTAKKHEFTADDMDAADYYALSGGKAFAPVKGAGTLGANQCWLQFDKQQTPGARQLTIVFDETTGINEVIEVSDDSWYDLNGRKFDGEPTTKGVYIQNGRKVVIK